MACYKSVTFHPLGFIVLDGESEFGYLDGTKGIPDKTQPQPQVHVSQANRIDITRDCPGCKGSGDLIDGVCPTCDSSGKILLCGKCGKIRFHGEPCDNGCTTKRTAAVAKAIQHLSPGQHMKLAEKNKQAPWTVCTLCQGFGENFSGTVCSKCSGLGRIYGHPEKEKEN